jgi:hypothetical protein
MNDKSKNFVDKFQILEKALIEISDSKDATQFHDILTNAERKNVFIKNHRGLLEDLYALRNVFVHRNRSKYIAEINEMANEKIDEMIQSLKEPPTVISLFETDVYQAYYGDFISEIADKMQEKKYTHIPVWTDNKFIGVFSYTSFFDWIVLAQRESPEEITFTKKFMRDINAKYLNSPIVNYQFIKESMSIYEIPIIFEKAVSSRKRLDCLLITNQGKKHEKITGIITSWDLPLIN